MWPRAIALLLVLLPLPAFAADWYTGAKPQASTEDWVVSVDVSTDVTSQNSYFGDVMATAAPLGTLDQSGMRLRIDALAGRYSYTSSTAQQTVNGTQESGSVLLGYEWVSPAQSFAAYLGGDARNNSLSVVDPANSVVGTNFGVKGQIEYYGKPSLRTMVSVNASYATNKAAYFARLRGGYLIGPDLYVGPEFVVLGDSFFNQERIGAHLTGLRAGPATFSFSGGYLYDRVRKAGGYANIDARLGF